MFRRATCIAVLAVVATTAGAAVAHGAVFALSTEVCNGTVLNFCWNNNGTLRELSGTQSATIKSTTEKNVFKAILAGLTLKIVCTKVEGLGDIITQTEPLVKIETLSGVIMFLGCAISAESSAELFKKCKVPAERETKELTGSFTSTTEELIKPKTGTVFIEFPFENNGSETCPASIKGSRSVTGEEILEILKPETAETTKKFVASVSKTKEKLKMGEESATIEGEFEEGFEGLGDELVIVKTA